MNDTKSEAPAISKLDTPENVSENITAWFHMHKSFFNRTVSCFVDGDGPYLPREGMLSVAGQINHVTAALEYMMSGVIVSFDRFKERDWMSRRHGEQWLGLDGGFTSMGWTKIANREHNRVMSIPQELWAFNATIDMAGELFAELSASEMITPLPVNPMHIEKPRIALAIALDHTAHHRGALAQYARMLNRAPKIPYFDMPESLHEEQF